MIDYDYKKPGSLAEVLSLLGEYGDRAKMIAGGTDLMVTMRNTNRSPEILISLRGLRDLCYIRKADGYRIGALTTHRMLELSDLVKRELSALNDAAGWIGSVQVRNVATLGGNICTAAPSADTAGPLLVMDATAILEGPGGQRSVPLTEFFTGTYGTVKEKDEVLLEFQIPAEMESFGSAYFKHARRAAMNLPILGVAVSVKLSEGVQIADARIALTVAAPTPIRAHQAEAFLRGKPLSDGVLSEAGKIAASPDCCTPRTSLRCEAWYRREMIAVLVPRMARLAADRVKNRS
jgi:carbon-monoxide dehydrogenase medium subunit